MVEQWALNPYVKVRFLPPVPKEINMRNRCNMCWFRYSLSCFTNIGVCIFCFNRLNWPEDFNVHECNGIDVYQEDAIITDEYAFSDIYE